MWLRRSPELQALHAAASSVPGRLLPSLARIGSARVGLSSRSRLPWSSKMPVSGPNRISLSASSAPAVLVTYAIVGWFIGCQNTRCSSSKPRSIRHKSMPDVASCWSNVFDSRKKIDKSGKKIRHMRRL